MVMMMMTANTWLGVFCRMYDEQTENYMKKATKKKRNCKCFSFMHTKTELHLCTTVQCIVDHRRLCVYVWMYENLTHLR